MFDSCFHNPRYLLLSPAFPFDKLFSSKCCGVSWFYTAWCDSYDGNVSVLPLLRNTPSPTKMWGHHQQGDHVQKYITELFTKTNNGEGFPSFDGSPNNPTRCFTTRQTLPYRYSLPTKKAHTTHHHTCVKNSSFFQEGLVVQPYHHTPPTSY